MRPEDLNEVILNAVCWGCRKAIDGPMCYLPTFMGAYVGPICGPCVLGMIDRLEAIDRHLRN